MESRVADVTVNVADPERLPTVAVIIVVPGASATAPLLPLKVLEKETTPGTEDLQLTLAETSCRPPLV
jgi:hypothetical protein